MVTCSTRASTAVRSTDTDHALCDDDQTAGQRVEVVVLDEAAKHVEHNRWSLVAEPEHDHTAVGADGVLADVAKLNIECDEHSLSAPSGCHHVRVGGTRQAFMGDRVDVMTARCEERCSCSGDVLVELELHKLGRRGRTSCFASHAPYAAAARTPFPSIVG